MLRTNLTVLFVLLVFVLTARAEVDYTEISFGTHASDAWFKCMADLNGDGRDDLVIGASFGPHEWYESKAGDTWEKHVIDDEAEGTESAGWCDDIDGDGDTDLIIGGTLYFNPGGAAVTSSWPKHVLKSGRAYHDTRMADFDGDGKTDIAARTESSPSVDIYYQNSPTSWTKFVSNPGFGSNGLEAVDIDGDGNPDIVTARHWMRNPGFRQGSWTAHSFNSNWDSYAAITYADMNKDTRQDIVITVSENSPGPVVWFENPPDPTSTSQWTAHSISADNTESCHSLWVTDVDKDGNQDVFTSEFRAQKRVLVYYGNADGSAFTTQVISNAGIHNGAIGDYDNDGDIDYFGTVVFGTGSIRVFRNDSLSLDDWTYIQIDNIRASQEFGLGWGDLDGDGDLDVVSGPYVYENPGGDMSASWNRTTLPANADANFILDSDGDGRAEILAQALPNIYWFEATSAAATAYDSTIVANNIPATSHGSSQGYAMGELIGGGHREYALSNGGGIHYLQVPADPAAGNWPTVQITSQSPEEGLDLGDIDGDGLNDAVGWVGSGSGSNTLGWWKNPGTGAGNWTQYNIGTVQGSEGDRIAVGDFDLDGKLDVAATGTTNSTSGSYVNWFRNPGNPTGNTVWNRTTVAANLGAMNSMDAADIDLDGDFDIVTGEHRGPLAVTIWRNGNGGSSWTPQEVSTGIENHLGTRLADLDGDGDLDLLGIAYDDFSKLHLWRNDAFGGGGGDSTPPGLVAATTFGDPNKVRVEFGEAVTQISAQSIGNYSISDGISVLDAQLQGNGLSVILSTSALSDSVSYTLTVNNVQDSAGNSIAPDSQSSFQFAQIDPSAGLVGFWPFSEQAGSTTADLSGGGHTGQIQGPGWNPIGKIGGALQFDGDSDYVDTGSWDIGGDALSIALWIKADDFGIPDARFVSKSTSPAEQDHYWMLSTISSGGPKLRFRLKTDGTTTTLIASSGTLAPNVWTHVAAVYDGVAMRLYKDGAGVGSTPKSGAISTSNSVPVWIGDNPTAGSQSFDGLLDQVRIYNRALSSQDIAALMIDQTAYPAAFWLLGHGLPHDSDLHQDLNGDGVSLLMAYSLNLDPNLNLAGSLTVRVLDRDTMSMTFYAATPGITYTVESTTNLLDWTTEGVTLSELDPDNQRTATVVRDSPARFFLRLVVED